MQQTPGDLLARARGAGDQDPASGRCDTLDLLTQLVHCRGGADQVEFTAGTQLELGIFPPQQRRLYSAGDHQQQPVGLERFFDEIVGADLDGFDRGLDRAVTADHDHRHRRHLGAQAPQDPDPVEFTALQPDVENDQRRLAGLNRRHRLGAVAGFARRVALVLEDPGNQHPDVGFVVYNQDVMRHG